MSASVRGGEATLATGLLAVGTGASVFALRNLLVPGSWAVVACLSVLALAVVVTAVRALTRSSWAPTLAGAVAAGVGVLVRYGVPPGGTWPDSGSWRRVVTRWGEATTTITESTVPMTVDRPTELVVVVGALVVLLAADLTVAVGHPAWSGLALVTLWLPTVTLGFPAPALAAGVAGLCYLVVLTLGTTPPAVPGRPRADRSRVALVSSAGIVVVALVLAPIVGSAPSWASWGLPTFGQGPVGPVSIDTDLDMRQSLGAQSSRVVLRYRVVDLAEQERAEQERAEQERAEREQAEREQLPSPTSSASGERAVTASSLGPLRATTLTSFDGRSWRPTPSREAEPVAADGLLLEPSTAGRPPSDTTGRLVRVAVGVESLADRNLPVTTFPRTLDAPGTWRYDSALDSVLGSTPTRSGMRYTMVAEVPRLTGEDLEGVGAGDPGDGGASLVLPRTEHTDDVAVRTREIVGDADTPYAQAMRLQSYLRSTTNFTYDTRIAPSRTDDAVWDFLESRRGYCVQFATAMAVMARTLGIPSRVGVGFLPGRTDESGARVVTGTEAHAWPELYFDGVGWVRFEPTPAVQSGAPPVWSDPFATTTGTGQDAGEERPEQRPTAAPTTRPQDGGTSSSPGNEDASSPWLPVGLGAGIVLVLAAVGTVLHRRRSLASAELTPEQAWARLRARLAGRSIVWTDATTPRISVGLVREQVERRTGATLDEEADRALLGIADAVEHARYAPRAPQLEPGLLASWVDDVLAGVERAAKKSGPRVAARVGPD